MVSDAPWKGQGSNACSMIVESVNVSCIYDVIRKIKLTKTKPYMCHRVKVQKGLSVAVQG